MVSYRTPGVYFEWLDSAAPAITEVRTDIAAFVGIAERGPLHRPVKLESWTQFMSIFGGHIPQAYLAYSVQGYFANGGRSCWVVRVADPDTARRASFDLKDDTGRNTLRLTATSEGVWAHQLAITVLRLGTQRFSITVRLPSGGQQLWSN